MYAFVLVCVYNVGSTCTQHDSSYNSITIYGNNDNNNFIAISAEEMSVDQFLVLISTWVAQLSKFIVINVAIR